MPSITLPPTLTVAGRAVEEPIRSAAGRMSGTRTEYTIELQDVAGSGAGGARKRLEALAAGWIGKPIRLAFDRGEAFGGVVTGLVLGVGTIRLTARGAGHALDGPRRTRLFVKKSTAEILRTVAGRAATLDEVSEAVVPCLVQSDETDREFTDRVAGYEGHLVYDTGSEFVIGRKPRASAPVALAPTDLPEGPGEVAVAAAATGVSLIGSRYDPFQPLKAVVPATPDRDKDPLLKTACAAAESLYGKDGAVVLHHPIFDARQLEAAARAESRRAGAGAVEFRMVTNNPQVRVGALVRPTDHPLTDEVLFVTAAEFFWDPAGYRCRFTAVPKELACGPAPAAPRPVAALMPAVVADAKDPKNLGRVKVRFAWDDKTLSGWVRVAAAAAGTGHGSVWVPAPGAEVLVAFEYGDPSRPVVIGCLFGGTAKPPLGPGDPTADVVLARTARGTEVRLLDEPNKEEVRVRMGDGRNEIRLLLGPTPKIVVRTEGECRLEAKTVTVAAQDELKLEGKTVTISARDRIVGNAGGDVVLTGRKIKLN